MNETVQRNFSEFTWTEINELGVEDGVLVLPIGAIEQHGPHLTVDCDLVFADRFLKNLIYLHYLFTIIFNQTRLVPM